MIIRRRDAGWRPGRDARAVRHPAARAARDHLRPPGEGAQGRSSWPVVALLASLLPLG